MMMKSSGMCGKAGATAKYKDCVLMVREGGAKGSGKALKEGSGKGKKRQRRRRRR